MKLLMVNAAAGTLIGAIVSVALLLTNTWGLSTLIGSDASPTLSALLFITNGCAMFATLMTATAVWFHD